MFAFPPPKSQFERSWAWMEDVFNLEEIGKLCKYAEGLEKVQGVTGYGDLPEENQKEIRSSEVAWITSNPDTAWIYTKLAEKIMTANERYFRLNLWGFVDGLQYTTYDSAKRGHYDYHMDLNGIDQYQRKLTAVLQLSKPSSYEGGELKIQGRSEDILPKTQGHLLLFPSYVRHKVCPVTSGVRRSLVMWASGFDFT